MVSPMHTFRRPDRETKTLKEPDQSDTNAMVSFKMDIAAWKKQSMTALAEQVRTVEEENKNLREENNRLKMRIRIFEGFHSRRASFRKRQGSTESEVTMAEDSEFSVETSGEILSGSDVTASNGSPGPSQGQPEIRGELEMGPAPLPATEATVQEKRCVCAGGDATVVSDGIRTAQHDDDDCSISSRTEDVDMKEQRPKPEFREGERITGRGDTPHFTLFPTQDAPITPVRALRGSRYVDAKDGNLLLRDDCIIMPRGICEPPLKGKIVLTDSPQSRDMFVGVEYDDGTSLSYLPVRHTEISGSPNPNLVRLSGMKEATVKRGYGRTFVHMCLPVWAYEGILATALKEYQIYRPDEAVSDGEVWRENGKAWFHVTLTDTLAILCLQEGRSKRRTVAGALSTYRGGLYGDGLFGMRFRRHGSSTRSRFQLRSLLLRSEND